MKRSIREIDNGEVEKLAKANCSLMLFSRVDSKTVRPPTGCAFKCKTCIRQFPSSQALGGHMASHEKLKLMTGDLLNQLAHAVAKHECLKCGTGQALWGHMTRHRGAAFITNQGGWGNSVNITSHSAMPAPVLKKLSSSKRVLYLDLNLKLGW